MVERTRVRRRIFKLLFKYKWHTNTQNVVCLMKIWKYGAFWNIKINMKIYFRHVIFNTCAVFLCFFFGLCSFILKVGKKAHTEPIQIYWSKWVFFSRAPEVAKQHHCKCGAPFSLWSPFEFYNTYLWASIIDSDSTMHSQFVLLATCFIMDQMMRAKCMNTKQKKRILYRQEPRIVS